LSEVNDRILKVDYVLGILVDNQSLPLTETCGIVLNGSLTPEVLRRPMVRGV
jgi:hypothetical protein